MKVNQEIISEKKQRKLINKIDGFLKSNKKALEQRYGVERASNIIYIAKLVYPSVVKRIPYFHTPMYDALIVLASKMVALKRGMRTEGLDTEEFVRYNISFNREKAQRIPAFVKKLGGRIFLSRPIRRYMTGVAKSATAHGWPTKVINGSLLDDYSRSVETRNCQMIAFFESVGEGDIKPYCSFFDMVTAETLGIGIKQVSNYDSGVCKYCFYKDGEVEWPERISQILNSNTVSA